MALERRKLAIETHKKELMEILDPCLNDSLLPYLESENVITAGNRQTIEARRSNLDKLNELFKFLKVKEKGCLGLIDFLKYEGHLEMAEKLETYLSGPSRQAENAKSLGDKKKEILQKRLNELCDVLDPNLIIPQLSIDGFITTDEEDNIARNREIITKRDKNRALVRLMVLKDVNEFWDFLIKYLEKGRYGIRRELLSDLDSA